MKRLLLTVTVSAGIALAATPLVAKTSTECAAEFRANRAKIDGAQSEPSFMAACVKGQEPVAGATSVSRPAVPPATAAQQPATPPSAAGESAKP